LSASIHRNVVIGQSGGATSVINASLVGAVEVALADARIKGIYGMRYGIEGLLQDDLVDLGQQFVALGVQHLWPVEGDDPEGTFDVERDLPEVADLGQEIAQEGLDGKEDHDGADHGEHAVIECQGRIHVIAGYAKHRVDQDFHQAYDSAAKSWSLYVKAALWFSRIRVLTRSS